MQASKLSMRSLRYILLGMFFITLISIITYSNLTRPRILIIHSYDPAYAWTRDLNVGLQNIFSNYKQYQIMYHYMDTKQHSEEEFIKKAGLIARNLVDSIRPAILLTVNNDAQSQVGRFYVNHPTIKVVYTGVNGRPETYGYDQANNVTGLLQRIPLKGLRDVILELATMRQLIGPIRIVHLSDSSSVVQDDDSYFRDKEHPPEWWSPVEVITPSYPGTTFDEWKQRLLLAQNEADFIVISNYRRIYRNEEKKEKVPPPPGGHGLDSREFTNSCDRFKCFCVRRWRRIICRCFAY